MLMTEYGEGILFMLLTKNRRVSCRFFLKSEEKGGDKNFLFLLSFFLYIFLPFHKRSHIAKGFVFNFQKKTGEIIILIRKIKSIHVREGNVQLRLAFLL